MIRSPLLFCSVYIGEAKALLAKNKGSPLCTQGNRLAEGQLQAG